MSEKTTTSVLKFSKTDYKRIQKGLHKISEFRNQITLDDRYVFSKSEYEEHCKETIKTMGECDHFLKILLKLNEDFKISLLKHGPLISSIQIIELSK